MNKDEILQILTDNKEKIRAFNVKSLFLVGSFANETSNSQSDVDLIVEFIDNDSSQLLKLGVFLEELLDREVDLAEKSSIKINYLNEIMKYNNYSIDLVEQ